MLAGHITLRVFGGFVVMVLGAGAAYSVLAPLPLLMTVTALEVLVAFLQGSRLYNVDLHVPQPGAAPRALAPTLASGAFQSRGLSSRAQVSAHRLDTNELALSCSC
jgi:hypothetical protein